VNSSSRNGARVIWVAIHTTEGILTAAGLRAWTSWPGSSHAAADAAGVLLDGSPDGFVDYSRAAWTLRNGNPVSDNLEMCGFAGWSRAQWLERPRLIDAASTWLARRCRARGITTPRRLSLAEVRGRTVLGIIDHGDYTDATGDGTHWDVGDGFPWDIALAQTVTKLGGGTVPPPPDPPEDDDVLSFIADGPDRPWWAFDGSERWYAWPGYPQLMKDLGHARSTSVKLIPPATLARIPQRDRDLVDEAAIVAEVVERLRAMTPEQQRAQLVDVIPTAAYVAAGGDVRGLRGAGTPGATPLEQAVAGRVEGHR
jgi:hypothetical protein